MRPINFLLLTMSLIVSVLMSCNSTPTDTVDIAVLLDRPAAIQNGKEWETVQNQYAQAIATLQEDPTNQESFLKVLEVFILEARVTGEHGHYYPAALQVVDQLLAIKEKTPETYFEALSMKASVLLSQHEFTKALICGNAARRINPYNAQIYGILTDALVELGRYEEAVQMADKMVQIRPDLCSYARISYLREIHGDVEGSIQAMQMAVQSAYPGFEQSAWTRLTLGDIYNTYGQLDKASEMYEMTLAERENYPFAIGALAEIEAKKGNLEKAEVLLNRACGIIPEFSFFVQLADLYQRTGRTEAYQKILEDIFVMLQEDVESGHKMNLEYADIHLRLTKDFDKALAFTLTEYTQRPDNIDVNRMLSMIYYEQGDFEACKKHLAKATMTNSQHPELLCLKGMMALKEGAYTQAVDNLQRSFQADPYQSHPLATKAKAYLVSQKL